MPRIQRTAPIAKPRPQKRRGRGGWAPPAANPCNATRVAGGSDPNTIYCGLAVGHAGSHCNWQL